MASKTGIIAIFDARPCAPEAILFLCDAYGENKWHRNSLFFSFSMPRQAPVGLHNIFLGIEIVVFSCFRCHLPFSNVSDEYLRYPKLHGIQISAVSGG